jgi:hypothetical protein
VRARGGGGDMRTSHVATALSVFAAPLSPQLLERIGLDAAVAATHTLVVAFAHARLAAGARAACRVRAMLY